MFPTDNYEHYSERLKPGTDYQNFLVKPSGYVEFSTKGDKKPAFLDFESNTDIQLVDTFCSICWKSKKPNKNLLNSSSWFRVYKNDNNITWVLAKAPNISVVRGVYEVWKRHTIPYSNEVYGTTFLGYVSLEKDPANFYEFYKKYKGPNFEERLKNAISEKAHCLFFNATISTSDKDCDKVRCMFNKFLGAGEQGIVARAIKVNDPEQSPIAVKMFYSRYDESFMQSIDLIKNEIQGRKLFDQGNRDKVAQLLHGSAQTICNKEALIMEYIDGITLGEFLEKNPKISKKQKDKFLQDISNLVSAKDLNVSNIMVKWDAEKELMGFVQIDLCLFTLGGNNFQKDLKELLESYPESYTNPNT